MKICTHCGNELPDEALFCKYCGQKYDDPPKKSRKLLLGSIGVASILLLLITTGAIFLLKHLKPKKESFDLTKAELVDNYIRPVGNGSIDLTALDIQPSPRDFSARWDSQLFYWLEDIGEGDDNHIAECRLDRLELTRQDNGKILEYEIYRDPSAEEIYKIVSIESLDDGTLELTDYYYQNGQPNFVFRRNDSVYTPSYASIDKIGERYYFSHNQMTKWRWIYEPSVVKQWILEPEDTWYTQWAYGEISDSERALYDEKERQILNEACHTYQAILDNPQIMLIEGRVTDENGSPLEGVEVGIGVIEEDTPQNPEIKLLTDENGTYAWAIPNPDTHYFLVFQKDGWLQAIMEPSLIRDAFLQAPQDDVVLLAERKDKSYPVAFKACWLKPQSEEGIVKQALIGEDASDCQPLENADIIIHAGINYWLDPTVAEGKTDGNGLFSLDLSPGIYTAEITKEGFSPARQVFFADESNSEYLIYTFAQSEPEDTPMPASESPTWDIILTWEPWQNDSADLDCSLFTPDKASLGDRNCINPLNPGDGSTFYLYDGQGNIACEYITLTAPKTGSYKYYVTNYTDIQNGNLASSHMADSHAKVSLYRDGIPVRTFSVPNKNGAVWEVFELRGQQVTPIQAIYENVQGKNWWTENKQLAHITEDQQKACWIQSDGEWLYFANPADQNKLYYCRKDGSDLTKFCNDQALNTQILLVDNQIYYTANGSKDFIARVNTDGSNREILAVVEQISEEMYDRNGSLGLCLEGFKDGILYYYWAPETIGSITALPVTGQAPAFSGNYPQHVVTAGEYLYYTSYDFDTGRYSFWKQTMDGSNAECLQEDCGRWSNEWIIDRGWIYYTAYTGNGASEIRRMKLDGTEDTCLARNAILGEQNLILLDGYCYYIGTDQRIYRMDTTGNNPVIVGPAAADLAILDGEIYTREGSSGAPIIVNSLDGNNQRQIKTSFIDTSYIGMYCLEGSEGFYRELAAEMPNIGRDYFIARDLFLQITDVSEGYVSGYYYDGSTGGGLDFSCDFRAKIDSDGATARYIQNDSYGYTVEIILQFQKTDNKNLVYVQPVLSKNADFDSVADEWTKSEVEGELQYPRSRDAFIKFK